MHPLRRWMLAATAAEQQLLAAGAKTSRNYLYQLADNRRKITSDMAARIEIAAGAIGKKSKGRLPRLLRWELSPVCNACPLAARCRKRKG